MNYWVLDAYLCRNAGDDLMVTELCVVNHDIPIVAPDLIEGHGPSLAALENLRAGKGWLRHAFRAQGYVMCGGSMFIDRPGGSRSRLQFVRRWVRRIVIAALLRARGRQVQVIGCNLGPVETAWGRVLYPLFLRLATRVTVRDSASEGIARGWKLANLVKAPDMVLSYIAREWPVAERSSSVPLVGISVMEWPGFERTSTLEQYEKLIQALLSRDSAIKVRLFGFQDRIVRDDLMVADLIERLEAHPRVEAEPYSGDVDAFIGEFRECTHIVAVRFHAGVLALGFGIPMIQIAYSHKIEDYLRDVGWDGLLLSPSETLAEGQSERMASTLLAADSFCYRPLEASYHASGMAPRALD